MSGETNSPRPAGLPLIPRIMLAGLAILLLSWLAFMAHYVYRQSHRPRSTPEVVRPAPPAAGPPAPSRR